MTRQKQISRVLSVVLVLTLLFGAFQVAVAPGPEFPVESILSAKQSDVLELHDEATHAYAEADAMPEVTGEIPELRQADAKVFATKDPNIKIFAGYGSPIHFERNGEWVDFDNRLELSSRSLSASGEATYAPRASAMSVSIPQNFTGGQQFAITNKGYTFGFAPSTEN